MSLTIAPEELQLSSFRIEKVEEQVIFCYFLLQDILFKLEALIPLFFSI